MDVEEGGQEEHEQQVNRSNVMASSGATGSVSVLLHPLVVMNISEHWTRVRAQEGKAQQGSEGLHKFSSFLF